MDLILCHTTADFDTLGAAVGVSRLRPGSRIVLSGGAHPAVRDFLALHRDEYPLVEARSINPDLIQTIVLVDAQTRDRIGSTAKWLDRPNIDIIIYDHHPASSSDISATETYFDAVGAITTLITELLQQQQVSLTPSEATVMALGIHADTGSLTYDHTTARDAAALAWLMTQGVSLSAIAQYVDPGLSPQLQELLSQALETLRSETIYGQAIASVLLTTPDYVPGLSSLASRLMELTGMDALFLAHHYCRGAVCAEGGNAESGNVLTVIARSQIARTNLNTLLQPFGGGGHAKAAALTRRETQPQPLFTEILAQFKQQIPPPPIARDLMSSPVRTIRPETTIAEAQRILLRYGHSGLSVVDAEAQLVGMISRRDLDIALHHGFSHAPVKGYMSTKLKTITPETPLPQIESLMVTYDIGRLPVLKDQALVGIVTRTDVLRQVHAAAYETSDLPERDPNPTVKAAQTARLDRARLALPLQNILAIAAQQAEQRGWHLYLVGGGVRDLLLADPDQPVTLNDLDLVVDGFHQSADVGAGVELARSLQALYPHARLDIHGKFQTAALLWHNDPDLDSLWIDIATARTEFYPYPAANPEVEASSIRQDLYRRDFTINALALRLTQPRANELLDFFGGLLDLRSKQICVLHSNSFIEDPTRIFRAVRFAVRLGFEIEPQTADFIRYAVSTTCRARDACLGESGRVVAPALQTRLKAELKYILQAPDWKPALKQLSDLGALSCLHPTLALDAELWQQLRLVDRWLRRFDPQQMFPHWQLLLDVLLARLAPLERGFVAQTLQLPKDSITRLTTLSQVQEQLTEALPKAPRPSQVVQLLKPYDVPMLMLVAVRSSERSHRQQIWKYLTRWSQIKAPLDGHDLKRLGYKQGRQFKQILERLLAATLDGEFGDGEFGERGGSDAASRARAERYLAEHYPLK
ncbi:CBS domain-containing protein [Myxacorys almedinensis A]|uniref:CBS domain-containing protein n=2 Tax=Myxacorys TaxID=2056239 RepID=A0A8J8CIF2_9CYAN|nr:CBS domain-containing protein [Myxacorys almedinensis]NDJ17659.1 CBS domain-containing protein [Myxacorys almedinensis A]